jgi:ATP-dependent DNA helicase RecG
MNTDRAAYGEQIVATLSRQLEAEYLTVPPPKDVGDAYRSLDELGRVILMLAHRFDEIGNADIHPYRADHPREIGIRLKQLVEAGWLAKSGHGRGTRNRWPRQQPGDLFAPAALVGEGSQHSAASSEQLTTDSELLEASSEHLGSEQEARLSALASPMRESGKVPNAQAEDVILALCSQQWLTLRTLARLLDRAPDSLRNHYINPMLRDGRLRARVPGKPNHPGQAHKTNE